MSSHSAFLTLHQGFSRVVIIYVGLLALWGLFLYFRGRNPSGDYLGALVIGEGVGVFQALLGLVLFAQGNRPHDSLHWLYGIALVLSLPVAYFMGDGGSEQRDSLLFGLAGILLIGISIRAIMTGG